MTTTTISDGHAAHLAWEQVRGGENECDAEKRLSQHAKAGGAEMGKWWNGWFERSDDWRDEIGHEG